MCTGTSDEMFGNSLAMTDLRFKLNDEFVWKYLIIIYRAKAISNNNNAIFELSKLLLETAFLQFDN